jgi:hypothetical protein
MASLHKPLLSEVEKMELTEHPEQQGDDEPRPRLSIKMALPLQRDSSSVRHATYANNQPKILLETISARTVILLLLLTYVCFIICEIIDFRTLEQSFSTNSLFSLESLPCPSSQQGSTPSSSTRGCLSNGNTTWSGTVLSLANVISVQINVKRANITEALIRDAPHNVSLPVTLFYNLNLWACYESGGCGDSFATSFTTASKASATQWHSVLELSNAALYIDTTEAIKLGYVQAPLVNITFQNQESVPTNGIVKSYYASVEYLEPLPPVGVVVINPIVTSSLTYEFQIVNRPSTFGSTVATILLIILTVFLTAAYVTVVQMYQKNQWLAEQRWLVVYFLALIMYQNPIYSAITVDPTQSVSPGAAYASYVFDNLGQAIFLVLWLCFADSVHNKPGSRAKLFFYLPKVAFGLFFFTVSLVVLTYQFPDLSQAFLETADRSPVEAVANWPEKVKITYCAFSLMFLLLFWVWALWWFVTLFFARRSLSRLPYMNTRYLQLSYRFFLLQATLVTLYYVSQYGFVIYKISPGTFPDVTGLTNNINTLFRQQTQLFGKVLFLTVYGFSLGFLFLPASFMESKLASALRATYVITEGELKGVVARRQATIRSLNRIMLINNLVIKAKAEVFCVDRALQMRNLAFEAYYDPAGKASEGLGPMDLERHGYDLVDARQDAENATFVFIARHRQTRRLVVSFRGTLFKTTQHWKTNLKYSKIDVDILALHTDFIDAVDDLDVDAAAVERERRSYGEQASLRFPLGHIDEEGEGEEEGGGGEDEYDPEDGEGMSRNPSLSAWASASLNNNNNYSNDRPAAAPSSAGQGPRLRRTATMRDTLIDGIAAVGSTSKKALYTVGGATATLIDQSAGLVRSAAKHTPVLQGLVKPFVHTGFWRAYLSVRDFVHTVVRRELRDEPADLFVTGHSLGGALGMIASLDLAVHTLPRINAYLAKRAAAESQLQRSNSSAGSSSLLSGGGGGGGEKRNSTRLRRIKVALYNFGAPKVGNGSFTYLVNKWVPDCFRVVVDGDVVSSLPPTGYRHAGTEVVVDSRGFGSIIIDRSFVERWLRPSTSYSIKVHSLLYYQRGILGIKRAAEYFTAHEHEGGFLDLAYKKDQQALRLGSLSLSLQESPDGTTGHVPVPGAGMGGVLDRIPASDEAAWGPVRSGGTGLVETEEEGERREREQMSPPLVPPHLHGPGDGLPAEASSPSSSLASVSPLAAPSPSTSNSENGWFSSQSTPTMHSEGHTPSSDRGGGTWRLSSSSSHSPTDRTTRGLGSNLDADGLSGKEIGAPPIGFNPLHSGLAPATMSSRPQPQTFPSQHSEAGAQMEEEEPWSSVAKADEAETEGDGEGEGEAEEEEVEEDRAQGLRGFFTKHVLQWLPGVEALGVGVGSPIDLRQIGESSAPPKRTLP